MFGSQNVSADLWVTRSGWQIVAGPWDPLGGALAASGLFQKFNSFMGLQNSEKSDGWTCRWAAAVVL